MTLIKAPYEPPVLDKVVISIVRRADGQLSMSSNLTLIETMRALVSSQIGLLNQMDKPVIERV